LLVTISFSVLDRMEQPLERSQVPHPSRTLRWWDDGRRVPHPSQLHRDGWDAYPLIVILAQSPRVVILAQPPRVVILAQPESPYWPLLLPMSLLFVIPQRSEGICFCSCRCLFSVFAFRREQASPPE